MRLQFSLLLTSMLLSGCAVTEVEVIEDSVPEVSEVAFNTDGAPTVVFSVPGMMCPDGCAPKVKEALAAQPGVKDVRVIYETKTATVAVDEDQFDPQVALAVLENDYGFEDTTLAEMEVIEESEASAQTEGEQTEG